MFGKLARQPYNDPRNTTILFPSTGFHVLKIQYRALAASRLLSPNTPEDETGQGRGRIFAGLSAARCPPPLRFARHFCCRLYWCLTCQPHPHLPTQCMHAGFISFAAKLYKLYTESRARASIKLLRLTCFHV